MKMHSVERRLEHFWSPAAGYIGSHVCKCLSARSHLPVADDNLSRGGPTAVKWGPLEIGHIADRDKLRAVLKRYRPAAVMHFAAFAYVGKSVEKPALYYQNNMTGSVALLEN
jgi:UDP-arabinose 4-epimerase